MNKQEREELNKKIKLYKLLGAEKFQKVVFGVEKIKFKLLKKIFPNFLDFYDKYMNIKKKIALKKAATEEEKKEIIKRFKFSKMAMRKEFHQEKNRNYHLDSKKPTEIYKYLEWNKSVHRRGLIKNSIFIALFIAGMISGYSLAGVLLLLELISTAINFECVNIQNYNICRYKRTKEILEKKEKRQIESNIEEFGQAAEVIHKSIEESEDVPSIEEVISNITDKEQLEQLKKLLIRTKEEREKEKKGENKGGKK